VVHVFRCRDRGYRPIYRARASHTCKSICKQYTRSGPVGNIDTVNEQLVDNPNRKDDRFKKIWLSIQKTKGESDVYVQNNVVQPGGGALSAAPPVLRLA
jgi:hypothetical protein